MAYDSLLSGSQAEFDLATLLHSFHTVDFLLFVIVYYVFYFSVVGIVTALAVFVFRVDYSNIQIPQLKRETLLTLESYTTNAVCYWIILQSVQSWDISFDIKSMAISYVMNNVLFSAWFYISHKAWHSNRTIYKLVHAHHHESVIVCPLTALSNAWPESVWSSAGFGVGPLLLPVFCNNVWGWYLSIFSVVGEAIIGHSRIPFTLEHASHHAVLNKNYGFYSQWTLRLNWDGWFGTWAYSNNVPKVQRIYPKESSSYIWNSGEKRINWDFLYGAKELDVDANLDIQLDPEANSSNDVEKSVSLGRGSW